MTFLRYLRRASGHLFRRRRVDAEFDEELRSYMDLAADAYRRDGVEDAEARRRARIELGGTAQVKESDRAARARAFVDAIGREFGQGFKSLLRSPWFTGFTIVTLALGNGASTLMFSVLDAVWLQPLPYDDPGELVRVWSVDSRTGREQRASYPDVIDWQAGTRTVDLVGYGGLRPALTGDGNPERLEVVAVLGDFFGLVGVAPVVGALPAEVPDGSAPPIVLGHGFWSRRFGSSPDIVGGRLTLDGVAHEVAAVMPAGFRFPIGDPVASAPARETSSVRCWARESGWWQPA